MKNKIYKYGFYTLAIPVFLFLAYSTCYGVLNRAEAFATYMNGGFDVHDARCALAFGKGMDIK